MAIRILDAATVGKISAGEVVERPSSVAKELIENSLDAGATSITVEIRDGGISYLRVTDNGCGIPFSEARMAFENHATSKLKNADGLFDIRTLGFRGEALPSIAAVSHVTMTTRTKDAEAGAKVEIEGGRFIGVSETGCPEGTTIVMRDLFFNVPVRRVFLKRPVYEQGLINELLQRMILGNPGVAFRLIANSRTIYRSYGDGDVRHAALAVYGRECAQALREVNASEGAFAVKGLIGVGDEAKPTRAQQCFFVNGRLIRCPLLSQALEEACRGRVTIGMYPDMPREHLIPAGNTSLAGARMLLLDRSLMDELDGILEKMTYIQFAQVTDFVQLMVAAQALPHTDLSRYPDVAAKLAARRGATEPDA